MPRPIKVTEKQIKIALKKTKGNVSKAARMLEVTRATIYNCLKRRKN